MSFGLSFSWIASHLPALMLGLTGLGFVIAFHEFGHFIFCRLFNVHVHSFSIGFGPSILQKKIGSTEFKLALIPLGGYVEPEAGQTPEIPVSETIQGKAYWQKMCIVAGGIVFNFIFAYVALFGLSLTGIPSNPFLIQNSSYSIEKVLPDSAAQKYGIQPGDKIKNINGISVLRNFPRLLQELASHPDQTVDIVVLRDAKPVNLQVTLGSTTVKGVSHGTLGIQPLFSPIPPVSLKKAPLQAAHLIKQFTVSMVKNLLAAFKKRSAANFGGPLMMISMTVGSAHQGILFFLLFLAFISVSLGVLNVLPLPILDGGQGLIYTVEAITQRPLSDAARSVIAYISWGLMLVIFGYLTFKDALFLFWK